MSIGAMANMAHSRRKAPVHDELGGSAPKAVAAGAEKVGRTAVADALQVVMSYIPTEIISIYIVALGVVFGASANETSLTPWSMYYVCLVATPVVVWIVYATKVKKDGGKVPVAPGRWPLWEMTAATTAFFAWACALPNSPFNDCAWHSPAVGSLVLVAVSALLGLLAGLLR